MPVGRSYICFFHLRGIFISKAVVLQTPTHVQLQPWCYPWGNIPKLIPPPPPTQKQHNCLEEDQKPAGQTTLEKVLHRTQTSLCLKWDVTQKRKRTERARCWGVMLQGANQGWGEWQGVMCAWYSIWMQRDKCELLASTLELYPYVHSRTPPTPLTDALATSPQSWEAAQWEVLFHAALQY